MLTIVIITYERGRILCETIEHLLGLQTPADELIIVDQTPEHPQSVSRQLDAWNRAGDIRLVRFAPPSIPRSMNEGLQLATNEFVLFVDDDVIPRSDLVAEHLAALNDERIWACVGQVLQPGEMPLDPGGKARRDPMDLRFSFNAAERRDVENVIACNLSVRRSRALSIGGFDDNFIGVAYRFETDFARRLIAAGGRIRFEPAASLHHLKAPGGGTRTWGDHKSSASPMHSVGDYYFALRHVRPFWPYVVRRLRSNVLTRFHLRHPWTIAPKIIGEIRGLVLARRLAGRPAERAGE